MNHEPARFRTTTGLDDRPLRARQRRVALLSLPEGVLNGYPQSVLTVYRPAWVKEFDDRCYPS